MIPCSDQHLNMDPQRVSHEFHEDLWCIVERHLPEFRRIVSPRNMNRTATFTELQDCISLLLHHSAQKAQYLQYISGLQIINRCFKYFLYLCSHINELTPLSSLRIIDGIDHCITHALRLFKTNRDKIALTKLQSPALEHAASNLDLMMIEIVNKAKDEA